MFVIKIIHATVVFYYALPVLGVEPTKVQSLIAAIVLHTAGLLLVRNRTVEMTVATEDKTKEDGE